jgi:hypothetical protein
MVVPAGPVNAASGAKAQVWLQALARRDAAALGDPKPRSISFRLRGSSATVVLSGHFACSRSSCPFMVSGPIGSPGSVRGTRAVITVDMETRTATGFAVTYPMLALGPGSPSPPARTRINFFEAAQGPAAAFSSLHHPGLSSPAFQVRIAARARRIASLYLKGRDHVLLVAPTKGGGFCTSLSGPYGGTGCPLTGKLRASRGVLDPGTTGDASGPILFDGHFTVAHVARLLVTYQDGATGTIPFVWVSKPISAGFFVYDLSAHRRPGHRPIALSLFDTHGKQLYRERLST